MRLSLAGLLLLAACAAEPLRLAVPPVPPTARVPIGFATVEVIEASLPAYAEGEEIFVQTGLALERAGGAVWADDPTRAFTLDLARALGETSGARVVPEPWPFEEPPEAQLDVRVSDIVADASGAFVLRGQYFAAARDGSGRDRARAFRVAVPLALDAGPAAIAAARGQATVALAQEIAAEGLR
jgi:hypothetical protein